MDLFPDGSLPPVSGATQVQASLGSGGLLLLWNISGSCSYRVKLFSGAVTCSTQDLIPPIVSLLDPISGDVVLGSETVRIRWSASDKFFYDPKGNRTRRTVIPEPGTMLMLVSALGALFGLSWLRGAVGIEGTARQAMRDAYGGPDEVSDLSAIALGAVVAGQGAREGEEARLRSSLERLGARVDARTVESLLRAARERFDDGAARFFLCAGDACRERLWPIDPAEIERLLAGEERCPFSTTGCQGPCEQAPVATLRVGGRCEMFAGMGSRGDWRSVAAYALRAVASDSLLVEGGHADGFRLDPLHGRERPSAPLESLRFLLGRFRGEGRFADGKLFRKEVVGSFEVGGRFLALRMAASHPLPGGGHDTHTALVLIGCDPWTGRLEGRAYTDGGAVEDYALEVRGGAVLFPVRAPHGSPARSARKILRPTAQGFDELLEIDPGSGAFEEYSRAELRRV
jgi:hypothetical protein